MSIGLLCRGWQPFKATISILSPPLRVIPRSTLRYNCRAHSSQPFKRGLSSTSSRSYLIKRYIVFGIVGLNVSIFVTWRVAISRARESGDYSLLAWMDRNCILSSSNLSAGRYWTIITSAFSHHDLGHLLGNMVGFWTFWTIAAASPQVTVANLLILASGSAISGSVAWLWYERRRRRDSKALGASGMVMGMGAAAACISPFSRVAFIFLPVPIPLWAAVGVYALYDSFYLDDKSSRVGHSAHLGGSAFGIIYALTRL